MTRLSKLQFAHIVQLGQIILPRGTANIQTRFVTVAIRLRVYGSVHTLNLLTKPCINNWFFKTSYLFPVHSQRLHTIAMAGMMKAAICKQVYFLLYVTDQDI